MIVLGEIKTIHNINLCSVHIPVFDTAGLNIPTIINATIATIPGIYNSYKSGDIVYIGFENESLDNAVILGKLFVSAEKENSRNAGAISCDTLTVLSNAKLPKNTIIGDIDYNKLMAYNNRLELLETNPFVNTWINSKQLQTHTIEVSANTKNILNNTNTTFPIMTGTTFNLKIKLSKIDGLKNYDPENIWVDLSRTFQNGNTYTMSPYTAPGNLDYLQIYINTLTSELCIDGKAKDNIKKFIITLNFTTKIAS